MFKKILLASTILMTSSMAVFANPAPYVGASVGITANTAVNVTSQNFAMSSYRGMPFALFAGYGGAISGTFYLAGEITGTVGTADLNDNGLKTSYGYGGSVLPGLLLCDHTIAYARLGILSARFPTQDMSATGGQAGLGLQTSFTQNVDLRFEYDFIGYKSVTYKVDDKHSYSITPRADQFNLALVYKFD